MPPQSTVLLTPELKNITETRKKAISILKDLSIIKELLEHPPLNLSTILAELGYFLDSHTGKLLFLQMRGVVYELPSDENIYPKAGIIFSAVSDYPETASIAIFILNQSENPDFVLASPWWEDENSNPTLITFGVHNNSGLLEEYNYPIGPNGGDFQYIVDTKTDPSIQDVVCLLLENQK